MGRGSHFVAMTTPMSLQLWWWKIFILIQLWSQFFQMFVYGDVVYAQTWYWPWKTVSSHLHMRGRPMLLQYGPHFFSTLSEKFGQLARFFWANGLPPPLAKNFPYAYGEVIESDRLKRELINFQLLFLTCRTSTYSLLKLSYNYIRVTHHKHTSLYGYWIESHNWVKSRILIG